jgi:hypothetical protein
VAVISPEYATEDLDMNNEKAYIMKESNNPCPHLYWENGESRCKIHHFKWYKKTPCFDFGQIESDPNTVCRLGEYILRCRPGYYERYCQEFKDNYLDAEQFTKRMSEIYFAEFRNKEKTEIGKKYEKKKCECEGT